MALQFPTPSELRAEYLSTLKSLKPEVDISKTDSDWYIRGSVVGGVMSGVYADQRRVSQDAFPQSARTEALEQHLILYFGAGFNQAQPADGTVGVTGTPATVIPILTEFTYAPNGNVYQSTAAVTLVGTTGEVPVVSVSTGQSQNLLAGAQFNIASPPSGLNALAVALTNIANGTDVESNEAAAARILNRIQQPPAGGTANDYSNFAKDADPSVVSTNVIRYIFGLGTIGIVITAGTTDIDTALNNGDPVIRIPSDALIDEVQAFVDAQAVLTDCAYVLKPNVITLDVTVKVRYASGDNSTVVPGVGLTQAQMVQREVKRAIYKTPPGGRQFGGQGFIVASEIEEVIDLGVSALPYTVGTYAQILVDRQVQDLSATGPNLEINARDLVEPGTISIVSF